MSKIIEVIGLKKSFICNNGESFTAVNNIGLNINKGESLGIIGESGSGKTTLAMMISGLEAPDEGKIIFNGTDITHFEGEELRRTYQKRQIIFQNPLNSFNPRLRMKTSITDVMINFGVQRVQAKKRLPELLEQVELNPDLANRYPHQLSGGECQRMAIARALAANPDFLIFDEATSSLDILIQSQILDLIKRLKSDRNISCLFISHDLLAIKSLCEGIAVMHHGEIVECGKTNDIINSPKHACTKRLLNSTLSMKEDKAS